jgi:Flp pilus assembly protein TadB
MFIDYGKEGAAAMMQERDEQGRTEEAQDPRVLSREEERAYNGVTIDEATGKEEENQPHDKPGWQLRMQQMSGNSGSSLWSRLLLAAGGTAVLAVLIFVVLPAAIAVVGVLLAGWLLWKFLRR